MLKWLVDGIEAVETLGRVRSRETLAKQDKALLPAERGEAVIGSGCIGADSKYLVMPSLNYFYFTSLRLRFTNILSTCGHVANHDMLQRARLSIE